MPECKCPRCDAQLREEDCWVTEPGLSMRYRGSFGWGHLLRVSLQCWRCSYQANWMAANVIKAEEVKL